jgi:hypothetical protein
MVALADLAAAAAPAQVVALTARALQGKETMAELVDTDPPSTLVAVAVVAVLVALAKVPLELLSRLVWGA